MAQHEYLSTWTHYWAIDKIAEAEKKAIEIMLTPSPQEHTAEDAALAAEDGFENKTVSDYSSGSDQEPKNQTVDKWSDEEEEEDGEDEEDEE